MSRHWRPSNTPRPDPAPSAVILKNLWLWLAIVVILFGYIHYEPEWSGPTEDIGKLRAEIEQRALARASALSPDFTVPDSFPQALELLHRLTGSAPVPFAAPRDDAPSVPTRGFSFEVRTDSLAKAIADTAAVLFHAKGFALFVEQGSPGNSNTRGSLVLMPDRDPYTAIEAIGTSGGFYSPTTPQIVRWLRDLENDQPFVITGIGYNYIEGRFSMPLKDARTLAKRFYKFCPDVVRQGTKTVANLAIEIREARLLYCWWD